MACLDVRPLVQVSSKHARPRGFFHETRLHTANAQTKTPDSFQNRGFVFVGATYRVRTGDHWNHNPEYARFLLLTVALQTFLSPCSTHI